MPVTFQAPTPRNGQTLKQFVFDHFVGLALKELSYKTGWRLDRCHYDMNYFIKIRRIDYTLGKVQLVELRMSFALHVHFADYLF